MKKLKGQFWLPSNPSTRQIKHFEAKKIENPYRFLKGSKDLLTPKKKKVPTAWPLV
eukprot:TRINITY_DN1159_c0_g1_i1.p1 TRINITY_DN1159_c0_g1~~TRINITY_DN1159_c0_g1_i1.p1  ORF type:complete len:56 (+),score=19.03 TRINITY_DN1159_c0_g1_i1:59-226(+)